MAPFVAPERVEVVRALALAALWWDDLQMTLRIEQPRPPVQPIDRRPPPC